MSHYFENDETLKSELKKTTCHMFDRTFIFYTDHGVFSKHGLDYGTRLLLESIPLEELNGSLLDVGCGYGVIGIILHIMTGCRATLIDVNKRALHLTRKNAKENHCDNLSIFESDCYQNVDSTYDTIVTNPPIRAGKKKVYEILIGAKEHLTKNGSLYFVVRKDQGAKSILFDLKKYYNITIVEKSKGFFIIRAKNS